VVGVFFFLLDEGRGYDDLSYYLSHVARRLAASQWRKTKKVWATGINVVRGRSTWREIFDSHQEMFWLLNRLSEPWNTILGSLKAR
jgi:hypothetical protein